MRRAQKADRKYLFVIDASKALRVAVGLVAKESMARLEKQPERLELGYPNAAVGLCEGLAEVFMVDSVGLSVSLSRCLVSTSLIESPSG